MDQVRAPSLLSIPSSTTFHCLHNLDSDAYGRSNWFNYINMTNSDPSGILRFLTDELQDAEDAGERGSLTRTLLLVLLHD